MTCSGHRSSGADCANETPSVATVMLRTPNRVPMNLRHIMSLLRMSLLRRVTRGPDKVSPDLSWQDGRALTRRPPAYATLGAGLIGAGPVPLINSEPP